MFYHLTDATKLRKWLLKNPNSYIVVDFYSGQNHPVLETCSKTLPDVIFLEIDTVHVRPKNPLYTATPLLRVYKNQSLMGEVNDVDLSLSNPGPLRLSIHSIVTSAGMNTI